MLGARTGASLVAILNKSTRKLSCSELHYDDKLYEKMQNYDQVKLLSVVVGASLMPKTFIVLSGLHLVMKVIVQKYDNADNWLG